LWRDDPAPDGKAPPPIIVPTTTSVAAVLGLSRRGLETTARAAKGRATADLDIPVRVGLNACVGRGEETGFQVEQRNWNEGKVENGVKYILTSKAPYKVFGTHNPQCPYQTQAPLPRNLNGSGD
jgi:hypothetical protein